MKKTTETYDVIIIGGGAAGLSAAQALGRARRSVLVVDAGEPRNAPAHAMHNYLSRDGANPLEFLAAGRAELAPYPVDIVEEKVLESRHTEGGFGVLLAGDKQVQARRLILAGGLKDKLPVIEEVAARLAAALRNYPPETFRYKNQGVFAAAALAWLDRAARPGG